MRIVIHYTIPDDSNLRKQWNVLVERMPLPEVFYTYEWAASVERAYREILTPWLLLQYEGDDLKGVAALATRAQSTQAVWMAGTTADYCDFLSSPSDREPLVDAAFSELRKAGIRSLSLANLPADSGTIPALKKLASRHQYHAFVRTAYHCAQVKLGSEEGRRALKSKLNGRKIFRRGINFLGKHGQVGLTHHTSWESIQPRLQNFSLAHVARFLATGRISNHLDARRRVFLSELAKSLSQSGWLVLSELNAGGRTVAWNYGFRFHRTWFWYQPTFESDFEQVSPGYCLLSKLIVEACDCPDIDVVDLGLGAEGYKERVANATRKTVHAAISMSGIDTMKAAIRHAAARAVKASSAAESGIRAGIRRFRELRKHSQEQGSALAWAHRRVAHALSGSEEMRFYQWPSLPLEPERQLPAIYLAPITLEVLARAAMQFEADCETQAYLLRAASRRKSTGVRGFALLARDGGTLHFGWTTPVEGFSMAELNVRLSAPAPEAFLIFDCWTPVSARGCGYYGVAVSLMARQLAAEGRSPWIFSAASNRASIAGLAKTAFEHRYSMIRRRIFMMQRVEKVGAPAIHAPEVPVGPEP